MVDELSVDTTKKRHPHSIFDRLYRLIWGAVWLVAFRTSFRLMHRPRVLLLKCFGAKIGTNVKIFPCVRIWSPRNLTIGNNSTVAERVDLYNAGKLTIGNNTTISQNSILCTATHDYSRRHMPLCVHNVTVGDSVWLCMNVFVCPDVHIGNGVVVGAMAKVISDLPEWTVCAGSPAHPIKPRVLV